ncbi:hypothetical protein [Novosphingobium panipatense]|uniref:hypothetical protein n=1 Tax=Novosphingobium panipatense TaxID=428991 RepID=UPI0036217F9B
MNSERAAATRGGMKGSLLLAGCVCLLALPSAVLAFSADFTQGTSARSGGEIDPLASETTQENLSRAISMRSLAKGQLFPFTPAGTPNRPDRAVTVAVRVDPEAAQAIIVRDARPPRRPRHRLIASTWRPPRSISASRAGIRTSRRTWSLRRLPAPGAAARSQALQPLARQQPQGRIAFLAPDLDR